MSSVWAPGPASLNQINGKQVIYCVSVYACTHALTFGKQLAITVDTVRKISPQLLCSARCED